VGFVGPNNVITGVPFAEMILAHILVNKLDNDTRTQWELQSVGTKGSQRLPVVLAYLEERSRAFDRVNPTEIASSFIKKVNAATIKPENSNEFQKTTIMSPVTRSQSGGSNSGGAMGGRGAYVEPVGGNYCVLGCGNNRHALYMCSKFRDLNQPMARWNAVVRMKWCTNCLACEHTADVCKSSRSCTICQGRHHTMLHAAFLNNNNRVNICRFSKGRKVLQDRLAGERWRFGHGKGTGYKSKVIAERNVGNFNRKACEPPTKMLAVEEKSDSSGSEVEVEEEFLLTSEDDEGVSEMRGGQVSERESESEDEMRGWSEDEGRVVDARCLHISCARETPCVSQSQRQKITDDGPLLKR